MIDALNGWSARVDASLGLMSGAFSDLRTEVVGTQGALVAAVQEAKMALGTMHEGFRAALETHSATQRAISEALVVDARLKFDDLEPMLSGVVSQTEQWALGEGARTAQQIAGSLGTPEGTPQPSPRMQPAADPWARQDPWRAPSFGPAPRSMRGAAFEAYPGPGAATAAAAGPAPAMPPAVPPLAGMGGRPFREFRIDSRGWSSHQKSLDAGVSPEAFQVWRERALVHLSQGRQDIRRLLTWAEGETAAEVQARAVDRAMMPDFVQVNFALHGAIMQIIGDSLLGRRVAATSTACCCGGTCAPSGRVLPPSTGTPRPSSSKTRPGPRTWLRSGRRCRPGSALGRKSGRPASTPRRGDVGRA